MHTSTMLCSSLAGSALPLRAMQKNFRSARPSALVCRAAKKDADEELQAVPKVLAVPMVAALAGILMVSAGSPDEALAARSSGRVGGSSFRSSAPRSAPRAAPRGGGGVVNRGGNTTYNNYTVAPSIGGYGGGYGYGGGWGGGISLFPRFYSPPVFGFALPIGGFFNFLFTIFLVSALFSVIRGVFSNLSNKNDSGSNKRDDWD